MDQGVCIYSVGEVVAAVEEVGEVLDFSKAAAFRERRAPFR
jgi:hypothetical protein